MLTGALTIFVIIALEISGTNVFLFILATYYVPRPEVVRSADAKLRRILILSFSNTVLVLKFLGIHIKYTT